MTRSRAIVGAHVPPLAGSGHEPGDNTGLTVLTECGPGREGSGFNARALVAFFAIAYLVSWAWVIPLAVTGHTVFQGRGWPSHFPSLLGPMVAAFVVTAWTTGRFGVRDLLRRMGRWRIGWRWWLAALSPLGFLGLALGVVAASGGTLPRTGDFAQFSGLPSGLGVVGVALLIVVVNGFGEETGWRGYALPQLQKRFSPLTSTLILAGCWAGWHIPQFFALHSYKGFSAGDWSRLLLRPDVWCGRLNLAVQPHGWKHPGGGRLARHLQRRRWDKGSDRWFGNDRRSSHHDDHDPGIRARVVGDPSGPPRRPLDPGATVTTDRGRAGFWMTNHLVNPVLVLLLRSPLGRRMGRHLALLTYWGERSGQRHRLVVQYAREGTQVWIVPGQPERKTWWRNFRTTNAVELRLAGEDCHGRAVALGGDDHPEDVRRALSVYQKHLPHAARAIGVHPSLSGEPDRDPAAAVGGMVVVQVDLQSNPLLTSAG